MLLPHHFLNAKQEHVCILYCLNHYNQQSMLLLQYSPLRRQPYSVVPAIETQEVVVHSGY